MALLYSNTFQSVAHLGTVADFTTVVGPAWIVLDQDDFPAAPSSEGDRSYGSADTNDLIYCNAVSALGDQAILTSSILLASGAKVAHSVRMSTTLDESYQTYFELSGGNLRASIDKRASGSAGVTSSSYNVAATTGDVIHHETSVVGNVIEARIWVNGNSRPSSATVSLTDSTYATGRVGLKRVTGSGVYSSVGEIHIADSSNDFGFGGSSASDTPRRGGLRKFLLNH